MHQDEQQRHQIQEGDVEQQLLTSTIIPYILLNHLQPQVFRQMTEATVDEQESASTTRT